MRVSTEQPILPMHIKATPYKHQVKAYNFALKVFGLTKKKVAKKSKGCAYLMDMGTGKTITTIAVLGTMYELEKAHKVLIVAPKTIVSVWEDELSRWADFNYNAVVLEGSCARKADLIRHMQGVAMQIVIVNYESCWRLEEEITKWKPDIIICDESSKIKNPQAKASKSLHRLGKKSSYNMILTGTPVVNNPLDFFSQYKFLDEEIFGGSYYAFRAKYAIVGGFQNHQVVAYKNLDELTEKAHSIAYRVRLDEAVDLPDVIEETRDITLEDKAQRIYNNIEKDSYAELMQGEVSTRNVLTKLLRLSQITGGYIRNDDEPESQQISSAKMDALEDIIDTCIEEGKKVVVFVRFIPEIKAIEKMLKRLNIEYAMICGEVQDRQSEVDRFQTDKNCKVFIGQLQTVGMGLTLTAGSVAVFYSLDFNYANFEQAKARIHRIGQKNKCLYIYLVAKNTVDSKILYALKHKGDVAKLVVDEWQKLLN